MMMRESFENSSINEICEVVTAILIVRSNINLLADEDDDHDVLLRGVRPLSVRMAQDRFILVAVYLLFSFFGYAFTVCQKKRKSKRGGHLSCTYFIWGC